MAAAAEAISIARTRPRYGTPESVRPISVAPPEIAMPSIVCPVAMPTNSGMPTPTAYRAPRTGWNSDRSKRAIPTTMRLSAATWSIEPGRSWRLGRHLAGGLLVGQLGQPRRVLVGPGDHLVGGLPAGL